MRLTSIIKTPLLRMSSEQLVHIPTVTSLSPRVIRILGGNPSSFTLQGTNTYLISSDIDTKGDLPCVLIDVAEGKDEHLNALEQVLRGSHTDVKDGRKRVITDIVLSHWHHDHVQGLNSVLSLLKQLSLPIPKMHKYKNEEQDETITESIHTFDPSLNLSTFTTPTHQFPSGLTAYHTPGHTTDHLSFHLQPEGVFFSGDNVLGQGTSVFENLSAYIASLRQSIDIIKREGGDLIYPAHGPVIENHAVETIQHYIDHRLQREEQVVQLLQSKKELNIRQIVQELYSEYPTSLHPAAARGIYLHLHKLFHDGVVNMQGEPTLPFDFDSHFDIAWGITDQPQKARV
ncbi:unnamed protein product [Sympodiomycopsis kandeliae]